MWNFSMKVTLKYLNFSWNRNDHFDIELKWFISRKRRRKPFCLKISLEYFMLAYEYISILENAIYSIQSHTAKCSNDGELHSLFLIKAWLFKRMTIEQTMSFCITITMISNTFTTMFRFSCYKFEIGVAFIR